MFENKDNTDDKTTTTAKVEFDKNICQLSFILFQTKLPENSLFEAFSFELIKKEKQITVHQQVHKRIKRYIWPRFWRLMFWKFEAD